MRLLRVSLLAVAITLLLLASIAGRDDDELHPYAVVLRLSIEGDPGAQDTFAVHYSGGTTLMLRMQVLCGPLGPDRPEPAEVGQPCRDGETYTTTLMHDEEGVDGSLDGEFVEYSVLRIYGTDGRQREMIASEQDVPLGESRSVTYTYR